MRYFICEVSFTVQKHLGASQGHRMTKKLFEAIKLLDGALRLTDVFWTTKGRDRHERDNGPESDRTFK